MLLWLVLVLAPLASVGAASLLHALLYLAPALLFLVPLFLNRDPAGDLLVALARRREGRTLVARGCEPVTFRRAVVWLPRGGLLIATARASRPPPLMPRSAAVLTLS
jgi:hypothetical protein